MCFVEWSVGQEACSPCLIRTIVLVRRHRSQRGDLLLNGINGADIDRASGVLSGNTQQKYEVCFLIGHVAIRFVICLDLTNGFFLNVDLEVVEKNMP